MPSHPEPAFWSSKGYVLDVQVEETRAQASDHRHYPESATIVHVTGTSASQQPQLLHDPLRIVREVVRGAQLPENRKKNRPGK